jgi:hypothetical protein
MDRAPRDESSSKLVVVSLFAVEQHGSVDEPLRLVELPLVEPERRFETAHLGVQLRVVAADSCG